MPVARSSIWLALPALALAQIPGELAGQPAATFNDGLYTPDSVLAAATAAAETTSAEPEAIVTTTSLEQETDAITTTLETPSTTSTSLLTPTALATVSSSSSSLTSSIQSSSTRSSSTSASSSQSSATIASAEASVEPGTPVGTPFKVVLPLIIIGSVIAFFTILGFIWHQRRKRRINKRISGFHRKQRSMMPPGWDDEEKEDDEKSSFTGLHMSDEGHAGNAAAWGTPQRQMSEKQVDRAFEQAYDAPDSFVPPSNMAGFATQSISTRELKDERGWGWGTNRSKNHKQASVISKGSSKFRAKRSDTVSNKPIPSGADLDAMLAESRTGYTSNDAVQYDEENAPGLLSRTATMVYNTLSSQISRRSRMHQRLTDDPDEAYDEYGQKLDYGEEDAAEVIDLRYEGNGYSHVRSQTEGTPGRPLPMPPSTPSRAPSTPTRIRVAGIQAPASVQKMDSQISRSVKRWTLADERAPDSPSSQYSTPVAPLNYHHAPPTSLTPGTRNGLNSSVGPLSPPLQPHFFYHGSTVPARPESDSLTGIASRFLPANSAPPSPVEDPFGPSYTSMPAKRERRQSVLKQDTNASPVRRSAAKMVPSLSQPAHSSAPESPSRRRADSLMDGQRRSAMRSPAQRAREEEQAARSVSRIVREGRDSRDGKTTPVKERIRLLREQQSRDSLQAGKRDSLQHDDVYGMMTSP